MIQRCTWLIEEDVTGSPRQVQGQGWSSRKERGREPDQIQEKPLEEPGVPVCEERRETPGGHPQGQVGKLLRCSSHCSSHASHLSLVLPSFQPQLWKTELGWEGNRGQTGPQRCSQGEPQAQPSFALYFLSPSWTWMFPLLGSDLGV